MALKVVDIQVFGRHLKLNCPENAVEALNESAKDLEQRLNDVRDKSQILSSNQIIITTAINLAYELKKEREIVHELEARYAKRFAILNKKLESVLNNSKQCMTSKKS